MKDLLTKAADGAVTPEEQREGRLTSAIENQTAKLPSDVFLGAAMVSMGAALALKLMGRNHTALFVGQWAAPFLLLGIYNKIVKVAGHDRDSRREEEEDDE